MHVSLFTTCMPGAHRGEKSVLDPLGSGFYTAIL